MTSEVRRSVIEAENGLYYMVQLSSRPGPHTASTEDLTTNDSHHTHSTQWAPPVDSWDSGNGLPYGWESAVDHEGKPYYINHVEKVTTRDDPRDDPDYVEPPKPREVELVRDPAMGFGFVAGSEKPVIVRFVTEDRAAGGPSEEKLLPGDQIIKVNGEDVKKAAREHVIELVRSCKTSVTLTVCQPYTDNSTRKSALLTAAKKAKLKNNPSRVRFAEAVIVNGAPVTIPSAHESYIPFMPNVLKVFLENGQTKSFKYDNKTTVKDVLNALQEKLNITCIEHFALVLLNMKSPCHKKHSLLQETDSLAELCLQIAARPGSQHFKCLFRVAFVPKDAYDLLRKDNTAFEYFFMQCCNDVVQGRFASELKYDVALRLAALHIHQQTISTSNNQGKISIKAIEKECGLDRFVPHSLLDTMKGKDLRKMLSHYMKANQSLAAPGQKHLTGLQAKLHYLKIISELRSFGTKCFMATLMEKKTEAMILVGPKCGIAVVTNIKSNTLAVLAEYDDIEAISLSKESDTMQRIDIHLKNGNTCTAVCMLNEDVQDFVAMIEGYYHLFVDQTKVLLRSTNILPNNNTDPNVPPYHSKHQVIAAPWSYTKETLTDTGDGGGQEEDGADIKLNIIDKQRLVDLGQGPPSYQESKEHGDEGKITDEIKENGQVKLRKPSELKTSDFIIHAPLASPDASNISGSSESSINNAGSPDGVGKFIQSPSLSSQLGDPTDLASSSTEGPDGSVRDNDSLTGSESIGSGISQQTGSVTPTASSMNGSIGGYDTRFGVRTFSTFSAPDSPVMKNSDSSNSNDSAVTLSEGDLQNNNRNAYEGGQRAFSPREDSETDTESTISGGGSELEKRPLIQEKPEYMYHDNSIPQVTGDAHSESDDTDSLSTPTDSPSKGRLEAVNASAPKHFKPNQERPQSFGLHSPDQLPKSESEFKAIASSFGLHSPDNVAPSEKLHPSYNPRLFCDGGLYLDPDIIDLTLIPPPKTPDQEALIDFSFMAMNTPPPGFTDNNGSPDWRHHHGAGVVGDRSSWGSGDSAPGGATGGGDLPPDFLPPSIADLPTPIRDHIDNLVLNDEELGNQLAVIDALMLEEARKKEHERESGIESETDSGNETISSENVDFHACGLTESLVSSQTEFAAGFAGRRVTDEAMLPSFPDSGGPDAGGAEIQDIDAFIASVTVPPPPKDSPGEFELPPPPAPHVARDGDFGDGDDRGDKTPVAPLHDDDVFFPPPPEMVGHHHHHHHHHHSAHHMPKTPSWEKLISMQGSSINQALEEEFAKLVIPPPPNGKATELIGDICIVPPVDVKTPSPGSDGGSTPRAGGEKSDHQMALAFSSSLPESVIRTMTIRAEIEKERKVSDLTDPALAFEKLSIKERIANLESPKLQRASKPPRPPQRYGPGEGTPNADGPGADGGGGGGPQTQIEVNPRRPFLWRPTEVRSADSSPVHRGKEFPPSPSPLSGRTESTGTLNRNKRVPPPPPPRRSSMPVTEMTNDLPTPPECARSISVDSASPPDTSPQKAMPSSLFAEIKNKAQAIENRYRIHAKVLHTHSNSETAINKLANANVSPSPAATVSPSVTSSGDTSPVNSNTPTFKLAKTVASKTTSLDNAELEKVRRYRIPDTKRSPRSASAIDLRRDSYEPPQKDYYTKASTSRSKKGERREEDNGDESPDIDSSPIRSDGANGKFRGRRSPSFTRKLLAFEFRKEKKAKMWANSSDASSDAGESDTTASTGSPNSVGRSHPLTSTAGTKAGAGSPRNSPLLHRHGSLSKMADRALSPLRNLFGGGDRDRTSSTESEAGSGPPSPHMMSRSSNMARSVLRPFGSAAAAQNENGFEIGEGLPAENFSGSDPDLVFDDDLIESYKQGRDAAKRGAPLKMPLMPSSSSESDVSPTLLHREGEADWPSASDTEPKSFRTFQVNSPRTARLNQSQPAQGQNDVPSRSPVQTTPGSKLPLWKGTNSPPAAQTHSPTAKHAPPGGDQLNDQQRQALSLQLQQRQQQLQQQQQPPQQQQQQHYQQPQDMDRTQMSLQQQLQEQLQQKLQRQQALHGLKTDPEVAALKNEMATARTEAIAKLAAVMKSDMKSPSPTTNKRLSHFVRCNITPQDVASKIYKGDHVFKEADVDVQHLIFAVDDTCVEIKRTEFVCHPDMFPSSKERLVSESRQFVTDSKLLVSSATQCLDNLVSNINNSMHTLSRIVHHCQSTMRAMTSTSQAQMLGGKVKDVAEAYKTTIAAAHSAAGRPLSDPNMKMLMRQATTLASILSMLMKTLKVLENS